MADTVRDVDKTAARDSLSCLLGLAPLLVKLVSGNAKLLARLHGVEDNTLTVRVAPAEPKLLLELVSRDVEILGVEESRLGGDGVVVLVNVLLLVCGGESTEDVRVGRCHGSMLAPMTEPRMPPSVTMVIPRFWSSALTRALAASVQAWGLTKTKAWLVVGESC